VAARSALPYLVGIDTFPSREEARWAICALLGTVPRTLSNDNKRASFLLPVRTAPIATAPALHACRSPFRAALRAIATGCATSFFWRANTRTRALYTALVAGQYKCVTFHSHLPTPHHLPMRAYHIFRLLAHHPSSPDTTLYLAPPLTASHARGAVSMAAGSKGLSPPPRFASRGRMEETRRRAAKRGETKAAAERRRHLAT